MSGSTNPNDIHIDGNKTVTAVFEVACPTECVTLPAGWNMVSIPGSPVSGPCWSEGEVQVTANGSGADTLTSFGVNPDATDCFDLGFDVQEPPVPPGEGTAVWFELDPSCTDAADYNTDIRLSISCGEEKTWTMKVWDNGSENTVTLTWTPPVITPEPDCLRSVTLTDTVTGNQVDMQTTGTYEYTKQGDPETREFTITVDCACPAGEVFGDDVSPLVLYQYNPCTRQYDSVEDADVVNEEGYWLWIYEDDTLVCVTTCPVEEDIVGALGCRGWHQISVCWPYLKDNIQFTDGVEIKTWPEAVAADWIADVLYSYNAETGAYELVDDVLNPWLGYWLYTMVSNLEMILDLDFAGETTLGPMASVSPKAVTSLRTPPPPPPVPGPAATAGGLLVYNEPNPIRDVNTTTFKVQGAVAIEAIRVRIFDLSGRLVYEEETPGGELTWHIQNLAGEYLANGVYLYRVEAKVEGQWILTEVKKLAIYR